MKRTIYTDAAAVSAWWRRQPRWWQLTVYFAVTVTVVWLWGVLDDRPMVITGRPD